DLRAWIGSAGPEAFFCSREAASLAARHASEELVKDAARRLEPLGDRPDVLTELVKSGGKGPALRGMHGAEATDARARARARGMTGDFLSAGWQRDAGFFWEHADVQAMLVGLAADGVYADRIEEALAHGALANARLDCGATPLTALCSGRELHVDSIAALLD